MLIHESDQGSYYEVNAEDKTQKASLKMAIQIKQMVISKALWEQIEEHISKIIFII